MNGDTTGARLRQFIERIERLEEEKRGIAEDIKDVKAEAKSAGFDPKIIGLVIKRRKMSREEAEEIDALLEQYLQAIGDFGTTPLGQATLERAAPKAEVPKAPPTPEKTAPAQRAEPAPAHEAQPRGEVCAEAAAADGAAAQTAGKPVTANPFAAGPLRAAWDRGWCQAAGGTGMELPKDLRRGRGRGAGSAGAQA